MVFVDRQDGGRRLAERHTRSSILPAVVFHAMVNISGEVLECTTNQQAIRLAVWVTLAGAVLIESGLRSRTPEPLILHPHGSLRSSKASMF
jgi:hypothetical protein